MTLILTVLAVLAGFTLLLAVCPQRRKQAAYGAAFVLAGGAFGLANGIPTVGGDAMAQPGCGGYDGSVVCPFVTPPEFPPSYYYDGYPGGYDGEAFPSTNLFPPARVIIPPPPPPVEPLDLCESLSALSVAIGAGAAAEGVAHRFWGIGRGGLPGSIVSVALGAASLFCDAS